MNQVKLSGRPTTSGGRYSSNKVWARERKTIRIWSDLTEGAGIRDSGIGNCISRMDVLARVREQDRVDGTQTFIVNMYSKSKVRKYEEWLSNLRCLFPTPRLLGRDREGAEP